MEDFNVKKTKPELDVERISGLLSSSVVVEAVKDILEKSRDLVVGFTIEFLICFPKATNEDVARFIGYLKKFEENMQDPNLVTQVARFYIDYFREKKINKNIKIYFAEIASRRYRFHAFNSVFMDSIIANGLDPKFKVQDEAEMRNIDRILNRVHRGSVGFSQFDVGKVSVSHQTVYSYSHGVKSPEWFAFFVSSFGGTNGLFEARKYIEAKQKIEEGIRICMNPNRPGLLPTDTDLLMTSSEAERVRSFFEKYWNMYSGGKPMLAIFEDDEKLVVKDVLEINEMSYGRKTGYFGDVYTEEQVLENVISGMLPQSGADTEKIPHKIPPDRLSFISLPEPSLISSS